MTTLSSLFEQPASASADKLDLIVPRPYQADDLHESFRLWDAGVVGVLTRIFTGGGKTLSACLKIRQWLERGDNYRAMIVSYERELVWQFAQEIRDFLDMEPGIEMGEEYIRADSIPRIVVSCRPSLLVHKQPAPALLKDLAEHGIENVGAASGKFCQRILKYLQADGDADRVREEIERINTCPEANNGTWSRLHKFDAHLNWLVFFDEAHKHAYSLSSVKHLVDWFDQNPESRRNGLTATPKRFDRVSIGHRMFPGIAIDYPLYHAVKPSAVKDGWAVPYVQRYIEVEGVDFKNLKQIAGDFDEAELERILGEEGQLAKLVQPLLDMVEDRRTLIFSPGVEMAKNVALFINARAETECPTCHKVAWYPVELIGTVPCKCGETITRDSITKQPEQARTLNGKSSEHDRKTTYKAHKSGRFQFLSVCGLCKEGYNDPNISCVAVFRPVSKKASSLAEQMKGRGCRPLRELVPLLNTLTCADARVEAIITSEKANCLIIDLVGITGLADCASTVQIYAEGLPDEVVALAEEMLAAKDEPTDVLDAIEQAKLQIEEKARLKAEREEQERLERERAALRAKADADVKYTAHQMGMGSNVDPNGASDNQMKFIRFLGMDISKPITSAQARRIITMLKAKVDPLEVAHKNRLQEDHWSPAGPSDKQLWKLRSCGLSPEGIKTGADASELIEAKCNVNEWRAKKIEAIDACHSAEELTVIAKEIFAARRALSVEDYATLVSLGSGKRKVLGTF